MLHQHDIAPLVAPPAFQISPTYAASLEAIGLGTLALAHTLRSYQSGDSSVQARLPPVSPQLPILWAAFWVV